MERFGEVRIVDETTGFGLNFKVFRTSSVLKGIWLKKGHSGRYKAPTADEEESERIRREREMISSLLSLDLKHKRGCKQKLP